MSVWSTDNEIKVEDVKTFYTKLAKCLKMGLTNVKTLPFVIN